MQKTTPAMRLPLALLAILAGASTALASGATFAITGQGITLGPAKEVVIDGKPQPPQFTAKAEVGKPFTLTAQGMVLPRGGKEQPGEPEKGAWTFDAKHFKQLAPMAGKADKTTIVLRLEPTAAGQTRVRFVGVILGYERVFDVLIEVEAAKP